VNLAIEQVRFSFGGHEKFVFRHGWLKKGVDAVIADPDIFTKDTSLVALGVGKNMVRSIRFWCQATELIREDPEAIGRSRSFQQTEFAQNLLSENGWDPFLEDTGTLWLMHWKLVSNLARNLAWHLTFSSFLVPEFTKRQLADFVGKQMEHLGIRTTPTMIDREVDCCLRTYIPTRSKNGGISEDSLDCPLAELDLLRYIPDDGVYRFNSGPKFSLPVQIFGFALVSYLQEIVTTRKTIAMEECIYQPGSPGQAFKLDENSVVEFLETLEELYPGTLNIRESVGLRQIYLDSNLDLKNFGGQLLKSYYERNDN
jgi:hypothetical protein